MKLSEICTPAEKLHMPEDTFPSESQPELFPPSTLFAGTAWYYSRFRSGYPDACIDLLVEKVCLNTTTPVLDLGTGTGQIAIAMALRGVPVIAVDPDVDMLCEALRAEHRAGAQGVSWMRGSDTLLSALPIESVKLCAMGASFHWTDRDKLLQVLDSLVTADGAIAVLSGGASVWSNADEGWLAIARSVVVEYLGTERRAGAHTYAHPEDRHEVVLKRSPFPNVEWFQFTVDMRLTIEQIVGLQLSTSYASPLQLGPRVEEFKDSLRTRLLEANPSGIFEGTQTTEILLAKR